MSKDATPEPGTDLAIRSSNEISSVESLREQLLNLSWDDVEEVIEDPQQVQREIMTGLLYAESDDELLNRTEAVGLRELARRFDRHHGLPEQAGVAVELHRFKWRRSEFEGEGLPIYFIVECTRLDTGERIVATTGSVNVIAQLANMAIRGTLAGSKVLPTETEKPSKSGNYPMWLVRPPVATVRPAPAEAAPAAA